MPSCQIQQGSAGGGWVVTGEACNRKCGKTRCQEAPWQGAHWCGRLLTKYVVVNTSKVWFGEQLAFVLGFNLFIFGIKP